MIGTPLGESLSPLYRKHHPGRRETYQADKINLTYGVTEVASGIDTGYAGHAELIGRKQKI